MYNVSWKTYMLYVSVVCQLLSRGALYATRVDNTIHLPLSIGRLSSIIETFHARSCKLSNLHVVCKVIYIKDLHTGAM